MREDRMALTAYCKKCGREVEAGEICPVCGTRLGKTAAHAAWCVERVPVRDWMYWNSVMRLLLPAALVILVLVILLEGIAGGPESVERMLSTGFPVVLGAILGGVLLLVLVIFLLQGKELSDFVVDSRGIHETRYLPNPTPLKLIARLKSPALGSNAAAVVRLGERDLAWKNVARVQLWPEKTMILYYSPAWLLRIPVVCTPYTWEDVMGLTRDRIGRKKKIQLPPSLVVTAPAASRRRRAQPVRPEPPTFVPEEPMAAEELAGFPGTAGIEPDAEQKTVPERPVPAGTAEFSADVADGET